MAIFQLSVLSQNDPGAADGDKLYCTVTREGGGEPWKGSFIFGEPVQLPIPPAPYNTAPPTPTWWIPFTPESNVNGLSEVAYTVEITSTNKDYIPLTITIKSSELAAWVEKSKTETTNQVYREGTQGVFGFAQFNSGAACDEPYWIYTITAGVLNPKVNP